MAIVTNTLQTTGVGAAGGNREELSNIISRITPEDTPVYSGIGKGKAATTHPEWLIDTLRAPAANAQLEGDEFAFNATTQPTRAGNYTQIFRDSKIISETQEAVDNAGNNQKIAEQSVKIGIALKKDVELSILSNTASVAGATRVSGGLPSWFTTNVSRGAGGANGGFSTGTGLTVAATNGTQRAFTKALLDTTLGAAYSAGGSAKTLVVAPYVMSVFSTFMSDANVAQQYIQVDRGGRGGMTLNGRVDAYMSPYGLVTIEPDRVMATAATVARNAFILDYDTLEWLWLRPLQKVQDVAKTGDAEKLVMIGEGCLKVENEAANAVIADLFGLTSAS